MMLYGGNKEGILREVRGIVDGRKSREAIKRECKEKRGTEGINRERKYRGKKARKVGTKRKEGTQKEKGEGKQREKRGYRGNKNGGDKEERKKKDM